MTIHPHIIETLARQRMADYRREAAAHQLVAERDRADAAESATDRPQAARTAREALATAEAQER